MTKIYTENDLLFDILTNKDCIYEAGYKLNRYPEYVSSQIRNLCNKLKIKLLNLDPTKSILWDGIYLRYKNLSIDNILHEIAHFQIAKSHHRYKMDFALGQGPESGIVTKENYLINKYADIQEEYASVIGILWMKFFKIKTYGTFSTHSWDDDRESRNRFKYLAVSLYDKGFTSEKFEVYPKINI